MFRLSYKFRAYLSCAILCAALQAHDAFAFPIAIDASALTVNNVSFIDGSYSNFKTGNFDLAPGSYSIGYYAHLADGSNSPHFFAFSVDASGNIGYSSSYTSFLHGAGTPSLVISGLPVSIASHLSQTSLFIVDTLFWTQSSIPQSLVLLPGQYTFGYSAYASPTINDLRSADFTVNADGTVGYATAPTGLFSGSGTPQLQVNGFSVNLISTLSAANVYLAGVLNWDNTTIGPQGYSLNLLPGYYAFGYTALGSAGNAILSVIFSVGTDGKVQYDTAYNNLVSGAGSTVLTVSGLTIKILSNLAADSLNLGGIAVWQQSTLGTNPNSLQVLPGDYLIGYFAYSTAGDGVYNSVAFTVGSTGTISVAPSLLTLASPSANSLAINGAVSSFDLRQLGTSQFAVPGISTYSTASVASLALLPGSHSILATGYTVDFTNSESGAVVPNPTLAAVQTGSGTPVIVYGAVVPNPPVSNPGAPFMANMNQAYNFDGSSSTDPQGLALSYSWDFGDGVSATGAKVAHSYAKAGKYSVVLTVKNTDGASATGVVSGQVVNLVASSATVQASIQADIASGALSKSQGKDISHDFENIQSTVTLAAASALTPQGYELRSRIIGMYVDFMSDVAAAASNKNSKLSPQQAYDLIEGTMMLVGSVDNDPNSITRLMLYTTLGLYRAGVLSSAVAGPIGNELYRVELNLFLGNSTSSYNDMAKVSANLLTDVGNGSFPVEVATYFVQKINSFDALVGPDSGLVAVVAAMNARISKLPDTGTKNRTLVSADKNAELIAVKNYLKGLESVSEFAASLSLIGNPIQLSQK